MLQQRLLVVALTATIATALAACEAPGTGGSGGTLADADAPGDTSVIVSTGDVPGWASGDIDTSGANVPTGFTYEWDQESESSIPLAYDDCDTGLQEMGGFDGTWIEDDQLFGGSEGCGIETDRWTWAPDGRWAVVLWATRAPDFGILEVSLYSGNAFGGPNQRWETEVDLYAPQVESSGPIVLGYSEVADDWWSEWIVVEVTGKNAASSGYRFGLDAISIMPELQALFLEDGGPRFNVGEYDDLEEIRAREPLWPYIQANDL